MKQIKIGKEIYKIKKGDYILYNQSCYQFCAGDYRTIRQSGWSKFNTIKVPKTRLKEISFSKMRKVETGNKEDRTLLIKWYF